MENFQIIAYKNGFFFFISSFAKRLIYHVTLNFNSLSGYVMFSVFFFHFYFIWYANHQWANVNMIPPLWKIQPHYVFFFLFYLTLWIWFCFTNVYGWRTYICISISRSMNKINKIISISIFDGKLIRPQVLFK